MAAQRAASGWGPMDDGSTGHLASDSVAAELELSMPEWAASPATSQALLASWTAVSFEMPVGMAAGASA